MARSRNIKPGFFTNEDLAELGFATRLLFAGLWTQADKSGRLEDRPKRLKMQIFPADDVDVDAMLQELHEARMVTRYAIGEVRYVCIPSWDKHQNPHHTEKASTIPGPNGVLTVKQPLDTKQYTSDLSSATEECGDAPVTAVLIPDSGFLIPDSLTLIPDALVPPVAIAPAPPKGDAPPPAAPLPDPPSPPPAPEPLPPKARSARKGKSDDTAEGFAWPDDFPPEVTAEFMAYRFEMAKKNREAPFTVGSMKGVIRTVRKCEEKGESVEAALYRCMERGWRTPYPLENSPGRGPLTSPRRMSQHEINTQRGAAFCEPLAPKLFGEKHERNKQDIEDVQFRDAVEPESDPYKGF